MRFSLALLAVLLLMGGATVAKAAGKSVSRDEVLKAIDVFKKEPVTPDGFAAASTIKSFAEHSDTVHVSISKAVIPWMKDSDASDADTRKILLAAYLAGTVEYQLKGGKPGDDVYEGWEQVLATYAQLLHINSAAKIPEVEDLRKKSADGKLRGYAAEVQEK